VTNGQTCISVSSGLAANAKTGRHSHGDFRLRSTRLGPWLTQLGRPSKRPAWGIYPQVGRSHESRLRTERNHSADGTETELTFKLEQLHGRRASHRGGFRLSFTDVKPPVEGGPSFLRRFAPSWQRLLRSETRRQGERVPGGSMSSASKPRRQLPLWPRGTGWCMPRRQNFMADGSHRPGAMRPGSHAQNAADIRKAPATSSNPGSVSCVAGAFPRSSKLPANHVEGARRGGRLAKWKLRPPRTR